MKSQIIIYFYLFSLLFCLGGCGDQSDGYVGNNSAYIPILMDTSSLINSIHFETARKIKTNGRIFVDSKRLFVVEQDSGVHFFDNTDPSNPKPIGFLRVPCCQDIIIKGNIMYVNNAVDFVTLDVSDLRNPIVKKRIRNVFLSPKTPDKIELQWPYTRIPKNTVIVGWTRR